MNQHAEEWARALDESLLDTDTLADWLYGACMHTHVRAEAAAKLAADLSVGRPLNATPAVAVPELLFMLLTETPEVAMQARALLRDRYFAEQSDKVAAIFWRHQDARERGDGPCEAFKQWSDRNDDAGGCEFDRVPA